MGQGCDSEHCFSPSPQPVNSLSPTSLAFGSQLVGTTSAARTVTVSNTGNGTLSLTGIALGGANPSQYARSNAADTSSGEELERHEPPFTKKGGMLILPPSHEPLCVYHKSDVGRDGREIYRCFQYVHERHAALMLQHSRAFRRNRRFQACLHAARFTQNNGEVLTTGAFLARALATHPTGFAKWLWTTRGRL